MAAGSRTHLWLVLMKAYRSLMRHAQRSSAAHGMGLSDFCILEALLHQPRMLINEIGRRIELTSGSVTSAIDRLEARGLVARSSHAADRRAKKVTLTRSGRALITRIFDQHQADLDDVIDGLTRADRRKLVALLEKLGRTADVSFVDLPDDGRA